MKYKKHVFICTNERTDGRKCCGEDHGMMLVKEMKRLLKEKGMNIDFRAQRTGCLDACEFGPSLVVYPKGTFYGNVQLSDVAEIIEKDLEQDKVVERLIIKY